MVRGAGARGLRRAHGIGTNKNEVVRVLCDSQSCRIQEIEALEKGASVEHAVLICFDRNLGYGMDKSGIRKHMPNGDEVAARMRQNGYFGCTLLQTGSSCAEVEQLERRTLFLIS